MFDAVFAQAKQTLLHLMSPSELHSTAIRFLNEGCESEEAAVLRECSIEYGEVRFQRGTVYEIDTTLRCSRGLFAKLTRRKGSSGWEEEPALKLRIVEALKASLPSGYGVANVDARSKPLVSKGAEPAGVDGKPADPINYGTFTAPDSLSRIGRSGVEELLAPFSEMLRKAGLPLPSSAVQDTAYFLEVSRILRAEDQLPAAVKEAIVTIVEAGRSLVAELQAAQVGLPRKTGQ